MDADLENLIPYPQALTLRVVGLNVDDLEQQVRDVMERRLPNSGEAAYHSRLSQGEKYRAIHVTFSADSRQQLEEIYRELNALDVVMMTL